MNLKVKVIITFGTRPEAIKVASVVKELKKYPNKIETIVCVTAQHREMLDQVLKLFELNPDIDLNLMEKDQTLAGTVSRGIEKLYDLFKKINPDFVLIQGDTTTTFTTALAAFYNKTKVGHIEAGLRTMDKYRPFPEEINRKLTSAITDVHFAPTKKAKQNLLSEGIPEKNIFVTGNTIIDALFITLDNFKKDKTKLRNFASRFSFISSKTKIILVTAHRRENFGKPLENICLAIKEIVKNNRNVEIVYPVHLNPNVRKTVNRILKNNKRIHLIDPLDYESFVWLMDKSYLILSDSGGIQEEAPSLGKPVLALREVTERPEAVEAGTVKVIGTNKENIIKEIQLLLDDQEEYKKMAVAKNPFGDGKAAEKIVQIILG